MELVLWSYAVICLTFAHANTSRFLDLSTRSKIEDINLPSFNKNNNSFEIQTAPYNSSLSNSSSITLSSTFVKEKSQLESTTSEFQQLYNLHSLNNESSAVNITNGNSPLTTMDSILVHFQESPMLSSTSFIQNISDTGSNVFILPDRHENLSYTDFEEDLASFVAEYDRNLSDAKMDEHPELPTYPHGTVKNSPVSSNLNIEASTSSLPSTSTRIVARSSNRKQNRKQAGFQDIISGLVKLLGGKNVQVANSGSSSKDPSRSPQSVPSRINNRAPPRITFAETNMQISPTSMTSILTSSSSFSSSNSFTRIDNVPSKPYMTTMISSSTTSTLQNLGTDHPTGPITEWVPANGRPAVGLKSSSSTTLNNKHYSTSLLSSLSASSMKASSSKSTGTTTSVPETEVSYAQIAPTTSLSSFQRTSTISTLSSSSSSSTLSLPSPPPSRTALSESSTQNKEATAPLPVVTTVSKVPTPHSGIVLPAISKHQPSSRFTDSVIPSLTGYPHPIPPKEPTGSPFVIPVDIHKIELNNDGIVEGLSPSDQSVYIDGRRTYFNLMPSETRTGGDSTLVNVGIGYSFPTSNKKPHIAQGSVSNVELPQSKPINRPQSPKVPQVIKNTPVRIDTCIIGDEAACNVQLNETCRVEAGVSSCNCRLGYGRDGLEQGCKPVVDLTVYIKVDKINAEYISFGADYEDPNNAKYQLLEYEAKQAVDSVFSLSALAESYVGSYVNSFFSVGGRVIINATVHLLESPQTRSPTIKQEIRRGLISVIRQQNQNIGQSRLHVDGPLNPIPGVQDLDECSDSNLNDCSKNGVCTNSFGSFKCACQDGFLDKYPDDSRRSGRICSVCSPQYCNNRGECVITNGNKECKCQGNFIGAQCETDGEVLGVALGASLAALAIIVLTLICLCMWSRRWKRDQKNVLGRPTSAGLASSYNYFSKSNLQPDFHLPQEDRMRWPQSPDAMDNFYAQPEPISSSHNSRMYNASRPPLPTAPPPSTGHRAVQALRSLPSLGGSRSNILDDTDEDDQGHCETNPSKFHFPRPKSRVSQTGHNAYYDVSFSKNMDHYNCDKDYGVINAFPMKSMRPFHS